jgi:hypothetical protein
VCLDVKTRVLAVGGLVSTNYNNLTADLLLTRRVPCHQPGAGLAGWTKNLGSRRSPLLPCFTRTSCEQQARFSFFLTPFNLTLRWFYMFICFLNPLSETRVHEIPTKKILRFAVETLLPASDNRSNYSHDFFVDTPLSSRLYIVYLRYATILYWRMQVLLLYGGHQKVRGVVGDSTKLLLNNRPAESGALRFEIVSPD